MYRNVGPKFDYEREADIPFPVSESDIYNFNNATDAILFFSLFSNPRFRFFPPPFSSFSREVVRIVLVGKHRSRIMASDEANEAKPSQNSEPNNVSPFRCWFQQRLKLKVFKGIEFRIRIRIKVICWNELMRNNDRAISFLGENW